MTIQDLVLYTVVIGLQLGLFLLNLRLKRTLSPALAKSLLLSELVLVMASLRAPSFLAPSLTPAMVPTTATPFAMLLFLTGWLALRVKPNETRTSLT